MSAGGRADLDAGPREILGKRQTDRADERRQILLLHLHVGPVPGRGDVVRCVRVARAARDGVERSAAVRVVRVVGVGRGVDDDVDLALVRELRVDGRRHGGRRIVGCLRVTGVLSRGVRDLLRRGELERGVAVLDAGLPVLLVLDAGGKRGRVGAILELALVRVPVAHVEHERREQEEHRDHHRGEHHHAAALAAKGAAHEQVPMLSGVGVGRVDVVVEPLGPHSGRPPDRDRRRR